MSDAPIHIDDVEPQPWDIGELAATRRRLGAAANAKRIGVAVIEVPPGRRSTPVHSHADEEEQFFVLEGGGLSVQMSSSKDVGAYEIRAGDFIWHPANGAAHTMIAGPDGLRVLVVSEGSRTGITYLPRAKQFWLGPRWSPADMPHPFAADTELGPLEVPEPSERPPTIRNLDELELHEGREGEYLAYATRFLTTRAEAQLVLAHDAMPPDTHTTDLHFHSTREEAWFVLSGGGHARLGGQRFELRPGSFWLRRPNGGVGHRIEVGPEGMDLLTMGDLVGGDHCVYPERRVVGLAQGVLVPYEPRD
jgi:uncharacterized cupin superfamily protein